MIKCRQCECNCDPGDLINGICDTCREEEKQKQLRAGEVAKIMNSPSYQMEMEAVL